MKLGVSHQKPEMLTNYERDLVTPHKLFIHNKFHLKSD